MERIDIFTIKELENYYHKFKKADIRFFDEISELHLQELGKKTKTNFRETFKLLCIINKIHNRYKVETESKIKPLKEKQEDKDIISNDKSSLDGNEEKQLEEKNSSHFLEEKSYPRIEDLGLSVRSTNALLAANYNSLEQIINFDLFELVKIPKLGKKSVNEILDVIDKFKKNELLINTHSNDHEKELVEVQFDECNFMNRIKLTENICSKRLVNSAKSLGLYYIDEIILLSDIELNNVENIGQKTIKEVKVLSEQYKQIYFCDLGQDEFNVLTPFFDVNKDDLINDNLNLSKCTKEQLIASGIITIGDILTSESLIDIIKNFDSKTILEINIFMVKLKYLIENNKILDKFKSLKEHLLVSKCKNFKIRSFNLLFDYIDKLKNIDSLYDLSLLELYSLIEETNNISYMKEYYTLYNKYINLVDININIKVSDQHYDMCLMRSMGKTLEEVGEKYGLTRERIRQIENQVKNKILQYGLNNNLKMYFIDDVYIKEINNSLLNDDSYNKWFNFIDLFIELDKLVIDDKVFFVSKLLIQKYNEIIKRLTNDIMAKGYLLVDEVDFTPNDTLFIHFLNQSNIKKNDYTFYLNETTNKKVLSYIKRNKFIDLNDKNLPNIIEILSKLLDINDFDKHNVTTRILEYGCCPMGNGCYTYLDLLPTLDDSMFDMIRQHIKINEIIYCNSFYYSFKDLFPIGYNGSILYFTLKRKFGDEFYYSKGSLTVSILEKPSKANLVYNYLKTSNKPVENSKLYSIFELDNISLGIILGQNNDAVKFDNTTCWCLSKLNIDACKKSINKFINAKKTFFVRDLYFYISYDYDKVLKDNLIVNSEIFYNVINKMFKEELKQYEYDIKNKKFVYKEEMKDDQNYDDFDF